MDQRTKRKGPNESGKQSAPQDGSPRVDGRFGEIHLRSLLVCEFVNDFRDGELAVGLGESLNQIDGRLAPLPARSDLPEIRGLDSSLLSKGLFLLCGERGVQGG